MTAIHIGMGPPLTRVATSRLFDDTVPNHRPVDHVMIAGICGGLDPALDVGTLLNPELLVDYTSGATYRHAPPGDLPLAGKLMTTEGVTLDDQLTRRFLADGCLGVDMEIRDRRRGLRAARVPLVGVPLHRGPALRRPA